MTRGQRIAVRVGIVLGSVLLVLMLGLLVLAQTDWGRERVRAFTVNQLNRSLDGHVEIGRLEGNLMRRWRFIEVSITDLEGRPFVEADTVATRFRLRSLLRRQIVLHRVLLVRARVVVERPPGEDWNYARILPETDPDPDRPGWGSWIRLQDVAIAAGHLTVRSEWKPDPELPPAERERKIHDALHGDGRANIVRVDDGFQNIMDFRNIHARLSEILLADPDEGRTILDVQALRAIAQPFRPPVAEVRNLAGRFYLSQDSIWFSDVRARLPGSRLAAQGAYHLETADLIIRMNGTPAAFADLRWLYPRLPEAGGGNLRLSVLRRQAATRIMAEEMDVRVGDGELYGDLRIVVGDTFRILPTDLRFVDLDTRPVDRMIPGFSFPRHGVLDGRVALEGDPAAMRVDGDVVFSDPALGRSRVVAEGGMAVADQVRFQDLSVEFRPLRADLVRGDVPRLPAGSVITGRATVDGVLGGALRVDADLALDDPATGRSRVLANGAFDPSGDEVVFSNLRLQFQPLRANLVRPELPQLPAGSTITGRAVLDGVLSGPLRLDADLAIADPATGLSRVAAVGTLDPGPDAVEFTDFRMRFSPLRAELVRDELPWLPAGATIEGRLRLHGSTGALLGLDGDVSVTDPASGVSQIAAVGAVDVRDDLRLRDLDLTFRPLRADLVRHELPELPPGSTLMGRLRLDGDPEGLLRLDGDLTLQDPATGESRVAGAGAVDLAGDLTFHDLDLRLAPLQMALIRRFEPDVPLGGTLTGTARLDGRPGARLAVRGDLVHREGGEESRVAGVAEVVPGAWARVDARLLPLSLVTVGRFVPEAALHGQVQGALQASGNLGDLTVNADLAVPGGGEILAEGHLDLDSPRPGYDLVTRLRRFDLASVTARAPAVTDLTGTIDAAGRGLDPETMTAEIRADLVGSAVDGLAADEVRLRLGIANGLARVDSSIVRIGSAVAWADGEFGLVSWQDGELRYRVQLDSLHAVAPYLPPADTGGVEARPPLRRAAVAEARAAAERAERRRLVEAIATGVVPPAEPFPFDTLAFVGIPRDTIAGRLEAEGVLRGNVETFDLVGRVAVENLLVRGHHVESGRAEFAWLRRGLPEPTIQLDAAAEGLVIEGFALDSALVFVRHRGERQGIGRAVVAAWQNGDTDYRADVEFTLALDRNEVLVHDLALRFDTINWRSARPGRVSWEGDALEVDDIELVSDGGGLVFVDGVLPLNGEADLRVTLREVELAHVGLLLQDDADLSGRITLDAHVQGSLDAPRFEGVGILVDAGRNGQVLPDTRASFAYADRELTVDAELFDEGRQFASAAAILPIDLAVTGAANPRRVAGPLTVDVRADSLPIGGIGALTDQVSNAEGTVAGTFFVRGSWDAAVVEGAVDLIDAGFRLDATGVRYQDVAGSLRLDGSTLVVDSLVGRAGGPVRVAGTVDVSDLTEPGFDLTVTAENAWAMRTDDIQLRVDADLEVRGPFDRVAITGQARTRRGVIYVPESRGKALVDLDDPDLLEELEGRLLAEAAELIRTPSPLLANLEVAVDLHISPDTWVRSTDMNVEIYTPDDLGPLRVELDQQAGRLTLEGTVNSDRGEYSFMSRRFQVTRGSATFVGASEPDPILQIAAEHEVRLPGREAFAIRIVLGGTMLRPTLTVESDARPPIAQTDLFTYIALGRSGGALLQQQGSALSGHGGPTGDLVGNVAGLATVQMAALAANVALDEFESEMARELGLDVLHIAPADLPAELFTGRFADLLRGTEVEAGRYIGPRLFASLRTRLTTETRPGATVEYSTPGGYRFTTSLDPRFLPAEPTLRDVDPQRASVFGAFVFREWRF
jgi:translocation and assembly module TamB